MAVVDKDKFPFRRVPVQDALAGARLEENRALAGQIYDLLRKKVVELVLLPNQALSEKEVASCLDTSKTPVREAFIRLAEDRVVAIVPHSGTYVAAIDPELAREGFHILSALESSCAARAAEQASLAEIGKLRHQLENLRLPAEIGDAETFQEQLPLLHDAIFSVAGIPDARKLIDATRFEIDRIQHLHRANGWQPMNQSFAQLTAVVNAIAAHDGEKARDAMHEHLAFAESLVDALNPGGPLHEMLLLLNKKQPEQRRGKKQP